MTEEQLRETYGKDVEKLREAINMLEYNKSRTKDEENLLAQLKKYRDDYHRDDKLAYYDTFDLYNLYD